MQASGCQPIQGVDDAQNRGAKLVYARSGRCRQRTDPGGCSTTSRPPSPPRSLSSASHKAAGAKISAWVMHSPNLGFWSKFSLRQTPCIERPVGRRSHRFDLEVLVLEEGVVDAPPGPVVVVLPELRPPALIHVLVLTPSSGGERPSGTDRLQSEMVARAEFYENWTRPWRAWMMSGA